MKFLSLGDCPGLPFLADAFALNVTSCATLQDLVARTAEAGGRSIAAFVDFNALGDDPLEALFALSDLHARPSVTVVIVLDDAHAGEAAFVSAMTRLDVFWSPPHDISGLPGPLQEAVVGAATSSPTAEQTTTARMHTPTAESLGDDTDLLDGFDALDALDDLAFGSAPESTAGFGAGAVDAPLHLDAAGSTQTTGNAQLVEEVRAGLRAFLTRIRHVAPHVILGVGADADPEEIEEACYRLMREHHPDVYAHIVDAEVTRLAEDVFVEIRGLRKHMLRRANGRSGSHAAVAPSTTPRGGATVASGPRVSRAAPARSVSPRPSSGAVPVAAASSAGGSRTGHERGARRPVAAAGAETVGPSTERMRAIADAARARREAEEKRRAEEEAAREARRLEVTARLRRVRGDSDEPMTNDQVQRAAFAAVEAGNMERGLELFEILEARKARVAGLSAWILWLRGHVEARDPAELERALTELGQSLSEEPRARSVCTMLVGHVHRYAGRNRRAAEIYKEAAKQDPSNDQAYRWWRYANHRADQLGEAASTAGAEKTSNLFSRLFGKK